MSIEEITAKKDLLINFKRIDNRAVVKIGNQTIYDKTFHNDPPLDEMVKIDHRLGDTTEFTIEIINVTGPAINPWKIVYSFINSEQPVSVSRSGPGGRFGSPRIPGPFKYRVEWV